MAKFVDDSGRTEKPERQQEQYTKELKAGKNAWKRFNKSLAKCQNGPTWGYGCDAYGCVRGCANRGDGVGV